MNIFKQPEISEELKSIDYIIDSQFKENLDVDHNKFLIAEKNGIPYYCLITATNLIRANDDKIKFFDLDDLLKLTARGIENKIEDGNANQNSFLFEYLSVPVNKIWSKVKNYMSFEQLKNGFDVLSKQDIKQKEIKYMHANSTGDILAIVNKYDMLMLVNIDNMSN